MLFAVDPGPLETDQFFSYIEYEVENDNYYKSEGL